MNHQEIIYSLQDIDTVVDQLFPLLNQAQVITFTGSLGVGKTTLIQALLRKAGVQGPIQSPTYAYVNQYSGKKWPHINHFDLYRLSSLREFLEAGFDEYLQQENSKTLIEWPAIIMPILQHNVCHITIDYEGLDKRRLRVQNT